MRSIAIRKLLGGVFSREDHSDGKLRMERELVFFAKFDHEKVLQIGRDPVYQEQYELRGNNGGIRVRKICSANNIGSDSQYILCSKSWVPGAEGKKEVEQETTEDMFDNFRKISSHGLRKIRYNIPVPGTEGAWQPNAGETPPYAGSLVWEVDLFLPDAVRMSDVTGWPKAEWCKIDLELPEGYDQSNLPRLPDMFTDVFDVQPLDRNDEQQAKAKEIMDSVAVKR